MSVLPQSWIFFAIAAGVGLLAFNLCAKVAGGALPPAMFATIMYTAGFIAVLPIFAWFMRDKGIADLQALPLTPVLFAVGAGIVVIIVDLCVASMFAKQAPVSYAMAIVCVVSLSLTGLAGFVFFKEAFTAMNIAGIALALISIPLMLYK